MIIPAILPSDVCGYLYLERGLSSKFFGNWSPPARRRDETSFTCLAFDIDAWQVVGMFSFDLRPYRSIVARGTFVRPSWRRSNVASVLWSHVLDTVKPRRVEVVVVSDRGLGLVERMRAKYPAVKFDVFEEGNRKLRAKGKAA